MRREREWLDLICIREIDQFYEETAARCCLTKTLNSAEAWVMTRSLVFARDALAIPLCSAEIYELTASRETIE